jgi:hypothetical protein
MLGKSCCLPDFTQADRTSPIFTYGNQGTLKAGVKAQEHSIIYSEGQTPQLVQGEVGITKPSICVRMANGAPDLHIASRIYYGIHHPVQYNVKVKDLGQVWALHVPRLIRSWKEEDEGDTQQSVLVTSESHYNYYNKPDNGMREYEHEDEDTEAEEMDVCAPNRTTGPLSSGKTLQPNAGHS